MSSVYVIAEAGVNHNGDRGRAREMVAAAAAAGADAVKFQTFRADEIVTATGPKAQYQASQTDPSESQRAMLRRLELSASAHQEIADMCRGLDIEFLSTPFDISSLEFLVGEIGVARLKIASGEITNGPLLLQAGRSGLPLIISTGMSTLDEISEALAVVAFGASHERLPGSRKALGDALTSSKGQHALRSRVTLLHCTTEYPTSPEDVQLRALDTLRATYDLPVGLSDHSEGIAVSLGAVARGACVIEKHFTMDRALPGPDHASSLEPEELATMVRGIRIVEMALGAAGKTPRQSELRNSVAVRRSLVAARSIAAGEQFSTTNMTAKRPAEGLSPMCYWDLLGRPASHEYASEQPLDETVDP